MFKIITKDNKEFDISQDLVNKSVLLTDLTESVNDSSLIPLDIINSSTLEHIIKYYNCHKKPLYTKQAEHFPSPGEKCPLVLEFLELDIQDHIAIIVATEYLGMDDLFDLGTTAIAKKITGKSREEMTRILGCDIFEDVDTGNCNIKNEI